MSSAHSILRPSDANFVGTIPVVVIGGGGCGLTAALSAKEHGADVIVLERDETALGTTAMSTGLIPAAGSRFQEEKGIKDSPDDFAADIIRKTHGQTDHKAVRYLAEQSSSTVHWLVDQHSVPLSLVENFSFPGQSCSRMHGTPNRTGAELMGALHHAIQRSEVDILLNAQVTHLFAEENGRIEGVRLTRPDSSTEDIGCGALILACCGFAGNSEMLTKYIPEMAKATVFGHPGNKGDAILWGRSLGAKISDLESYQGHGGLAYGHGVTILWAHIMLGGFQVNTSGARFCDESRGYSEHAIEIIRQPDHVAWAIYDERIHHTLKEYADYREALQTGCIHAAENVQEVIRISGLPDTIRNTFTSVKEMVLGMIQDRFGRDFTIHKELKPPYYFVKVTGALFHTQGGLVIKNNGQVQREDGSFLPNLFAGGGAARGISGPSCWGYMSGNGLMTATTYGRSAGQAAAKCVIS